MDSFASIESCRLEDPDVPAFEVASRHDQRLFIFESLTVRLAKNLTCFLGVYFNFRIFFQQVECLLEFFHLTTQRVFVYFPVKCVDLYAKC